MTQQWTLKQIQKIYHQPLTELLFQAQQVHRQNFDPSKIQACKLMNIKAGACPEDCSYCSQSGHHNSGLKKEKLSSVEKTVVMAKKAKEQGATRFCMAGAWRSPPKKDLDDLCEMIEQVKAMGLETCLSAGMLDAEQTARLQASGLDYYNHNLDTSERYYPEVAGTRTYQNRLDTLQHVRDAGIKVCCGGIMGLGETVDDRLMLLQTLTNLEKAPESVPINQLIPIPGTPLADQIKVDDIDFVRIIAVARILMPRSMVRLSAGRSEMSDSLQLLCFFAGANSIFTGEKLLTVANVAENHDQQLLNKLGMEFESEETCKLRNTTETCL